MALCDDDQHAADLDIYISKNSRFKSFIYNRKEILSIAVIWDLPLVMCVLTEKS